MYEFGMSGLERFLWGGGFTALFFLVFGLILVTFLVMFIKGLGQWNRNNNSPRLTVAAKVVSKRTDMTTHHNQTTHTHGHSTWYYVTFEVESGDRMELSVAGAEYGLLVEGDIGRLTFQGTRYLGFERE